LLSKTSLRVCHYQIMILYHYNTIRKLLTNSIFNIQWEPKLPHQRSHWMLKYFLLRACLLKIQYTFTDVLDGEYFWIGSKYWFSYNNESGMVVEHRQWRVLRLQNPPILSTHATWTTQQQWESLRIHTYIYISTENSTEENKIVQNNTRQKNSQATLK
jgi:hypothetical protein